MASWGNFGIMISQLRGDDYPIKAVTIGQLAGEAVQLLAATKVRLSCCTGPLLLSRASIKLTDFIATPRVKFLLLKSVRIGQQMCALSLNVLVAHLHWAKVAAQQPELMVR